MSAMEKPLQDTGVESEHHDDSDIVVPDTHVAISETLQERNAIPNPWGKGHVQLYLMCFILYFCSTMNGIPIPCTHRIREFSHPIMS